MYSAKTMLITCFFIICFASALKIGECANHGRLWNFNGLIRNNGIYNKIEPDDNIYLSPVEVKYIDNTQKAGNYKRIFPINKKYDRNCFFSPVQCMLAFNKNQPEEGMDW
uniref:Astacin domain-containing protein n=1 Tax=Rhabditophanes sp. KR3021 TaxID=114890 RepID=A0AC35U5A8_9BILA